MASKSGRSSDSKIQAAFVPSQFLKRISGLDEALPFYGSCYCPGVSPDSLLSAFGKRISPEEHDQLFVQNDVTFRLSQGFPQVNKSLARSILFPRFSPVFPLGLEHEPRKTLGSL